jgi:SAM-dependent methyltransferase
MIGIDINEEALAKGEKKAQKEGLSVHLLNLDMRELEKLTGSFHGAINMWQSFGFFDDQTNELVIKKLSQKLVPKGRLVIDLFNREFFINHQGRYQFERNGVHLTETKKIIGKRLITKLEYQEPGTEDIYSFRLYTPKEITALLKKNRFDCLIACTHFDPQQSPSKESSRMQFVFEKKER